VVLARVGVQENSLSFQFGTQNAIRKPVPLHERPVQRAPPTTALPGRRSMGEMVS
jgi:hypothetical protein